MNILKLRVTGFDNDQAEAKFRTALAAFEIQRLDVNREKGLARILSQRTLSREELEQTLAPLGFHFEIVVPSEAKEDQLQTRTVSLRIEGMHCRSCELTIERAVKEIKGVKKVEVDAGRGMARVELDDSRTPDYKEFQAAIGQQGYTVRQSLEPGNQKSVGELRSVAEHRPGVWTLVGLLAMVLLIGFFLNRWGLLKPSVALGSSIGFLAAFLIGLVAASSSCLAVAGGLMLSTVVRLGSRESSLTLRQRMRPVLLFVGGRLLGYGIFGGLIGVLGKTLSPSPFVSGLITLVAALIMVILGLQMLHLAPAWLKRLIPRLSKSLSRKVLAGDRLRHPAAPLLLGAGTFFLPCGFTQALQLLVLTTGSLTVGASVLFAFALGTAPALLALGFASNALKGKAGQFFFRFSGALVVVLGLWNVQNGLAITGHPLSWPKFSLPLRAIEAPSGATESDQLVRRETNAQVVAIDVGVRGFTPAAFTVARNVSVRLEISGPVAGRGCLSVFQIPKLGISELLKAGQTTAITFTPTKTGSYVYSCSMGMFRGRFEVI
ncbi:sulfite exporter TauE/SafE family protein [Candidatus Uhrbacteria bacterium]|nr:sulfite exporter TauE/SafE family protein [Candidatus Uhrbacteria bacterium]